MSGTYLLRNGVLVDGHVSAARDIRVLEDGAVAWEGDRIVAAGSVSELARRFGDAEVVDAQGGMILPGLVNLHHHFYSALARGLDPGVQTTTFHEVLDRLWWRLDRALDPDTVSLSAALSAADCVRWGCTTVFDHHASPSCIGGSLDLIAGAMETAGLSAVLCYEVTDRNGHAEALAGIEENIRFLESRSSGRVRGVFGLHASFTLREGTLAEIARRRPAGSGCHVHVGEDPIDVVASVEAFGAGPVERLVHHGLLDDRALLAHGIHLDADAYETIGRHGATLTHNPESNANNGVGRLDVGEASSHGCVVGLGTDGMSSAMLRALRAAFLAHRAGRGDPSAGFDVIPRLLTNNILVARRFLDEPLLGDLVPGAPADIVVVDTRAPTPVTATNIFGHLVYGASEAPVRHTIARGRVLLKDGVHTTIDPAELAERARAVAPALWRRFAALPWGTSFLGE